METPEITKVERPKQYSFQATGPVTDPIPVHKLVDVFAETEAEARAKAEELVPDASEIKLISVDETYKELPL